MTMGSPDVVNNTVESDKSLAWGGEETNNTLNYTDSKLTLKQ